jgi:hypothetical protein
MNNNFNNNNMNNNFNNNNMNNNFNNNNMNNNFNNNNYNNNYNNYNNNQIQNNNQNPQRNPKNLKEKKYEPAGPRKQKVHKKNNNTFNFDCKNPLTTTVPIRFKTVDYFKLIDNIKQNNETAIREFKKGRIDMTLNLVTDSLEFLSYLDKK